MIELIHDNEFIREVWNGAWFSLALGMVIVLMAIVWNRISTTIGRRQPSQIYDDGVVQICVAVSIFVAGSGTRAAYIWFLLHCENFSADCDWIRDDDWIMSVAGALAIVGGLCVIRVLSPRHWRQWGWLVAGAVAIGVPVLFYVTALPRLTAH